MFTTAYRSSTFLEVPAMHRKEPANRDVFASEDLTLPCCYATVASSWQKVAQIPRKHAICQELYATGPRPSDKNKIYFFDTYSLTVVL